MNPTITRKLLSVLLAAVMVLAAASNTFAGEKKVYFDVDGIT